MEPYKSPQYDCPDILPEERALFAAITNQRLSPEEAARIKAPVVVYPREDSVLAVHWHPEFVPMELIKARIEATFPNAKEHLIIPTQHNELLVYDDYAGVEVDTFSPEFNTKVQLLLHFHPDRVKNAFVLRSMLEHTFNYRSSQLFDFLHSLSSKDSGFSLQKAAAKTGASAEVVDLVRAVAKKILLLLEEVEPSLPKDAIKNKVVRNYINGLRNGHNDGLIDRAQVFVDAVKAQVKRDFNLDYFYKTQEVIEETRGLGGCIVIPHPEQFWPILIADYDVDGIEVWNPQSSTYTDFLIQVVDRQNKTHRKDREPVLIFMGDDTHFGEKLRLPTETAKSKIGREVGVQPPWADLGTRKNLIQAKAIKSQVIAQYKERLNR